MNNKITIIPGFSERDLGDEIVVMHESGQIMHSLSDSAIFLWKKIKEGCSSNELIQAMLEEYDVEEDEVRKDIHDFLTTLLEKEIISSF